MKQREYPQFEVARVNVDGTTENPEIVPVSELPWKARTGRRGFLGAGVTAASVLLAMSEAEAAQDPTKGGVHDPRRNEIRAHRSAITSLAIAHNGRQIASAANDETVKVWSLPDGRLEATLETKAVESPRVALSHDAQLLAVGDAASNITQWNVHNQRVVCRMPDHEKSISGLVAIPNSPILVSAGTDANIGVWRWGRKELAMVLTGHQGAVRCLAVTADGMLLASGGDDGMVRLWNMYDGKALDALGFHQGAVTDGAFIRKELLVSRDKNKTIYVWKLKGKRLLRTLAGPWQQTSNLLIPPDGKTIVTTVGSSIQLRTVPDAELRAELRAHRAPVVSLAVSADSQILASGDRNGVVILWNLADGRCLAFLFDPRANTSKVSGVSYKVRDEATRTWITYTLPCGAPIPKGATCICNCVPGTLSTTTGLTYHGRSSPRYTTGGSYCSCNKVCICIPVCQAHRLLDADPVVRLLARQVLLVMGPREIPYMRWAAQESAPKLRDEINRVIEELEAGATYSPAQWPGHAQLLEYLDHNDDVTALMAAQLLYYMTQVGDVCLTAEIDARIVQILSRAPHAARPWSQPQPAPT